MELTKEFLEEKGFVFENKENVVINYIKKINDYNDLVISLSPLQEFFIWVKDEDYENPIMDGVKVHLDTDNIEQAEYLAKLIVGVEY